MKTLAKVIGFILLGLVALIIALPFIIPADFLFKQVTQSVEQTTGRQLVISGEKSLSVFPQLKLELNDVAFANIAQGSKPNMAAMEQLAVHIPYLSVLSGDIKLDKFVIRNPEILLEKMPDGRANWQLFEQTAQTNNEPQESKPDSQGSGLPEGLDIQLGEVAIYGGSVTYIDHQNKTQQKVSDLDLVIQLPSLKQDLTVAGSIKYLEEVFNLEVKLTTPEKVLLGQDFTAATKLESRLVNFTFDGEITKQMTDFAGQLTLAGDSVKELAKWQKQPLVSKENAFNAFSLGAKMHFANDKLDLTALSAKLDDLAVTGKANIDLKKKLAVSADIDLGMLNVNPYLPESIEQTEDKQAAQKNDNKKPQPIVWDDTKLDLSALNSLNANIKIAATGFQFKEIKLGQTSLSVKLQNGVATLGLDKFEAYQGNGNGQIVINAVRSPYAINSAFTLEGIQAEPLLTDAVGFDKLMGLGGLTIALNMNGQSQ